MQRGRVALRHELILRFDYGAVAMGNARTSNGIHAIAGPDRVVLSSSVPLQAKGYKTVGDFELQAGQSATFVLTYSASTSQQLGQSSRQHALATTEVILAAVERAL